MAYLTLIGTQRKTPRRLHTHDLGTDRLLGQHIEIGIKTAAPIEYLAVPLRDGLVVAGPVGIDVGHQFPYQPVEQRASVERRTQHLSHGYGVRGRRTEDRLIDVYPDSGNGERHIGTHHVVFDEYAYQFLVSAIDVVGPLHRNSGQIIAEYLDKRERHQL